MQKDVVIRPADFDVARRLDALKILNDFRSLGFHQRAAFVVTVKAIDKETDETVLNHFWAGRVFDEELNNRLQVVLDKLKSE